MLHSAGLDPATVARVVPAWAAMRTEVLGGQYLDIANEVAADESVEAATRVNRFKTAAYTIERPLHIGAALAGADDDLIDAYRRFGTDIGLAFQLRDDLLGVFGDPEVTGKPRATTCARARGRSCTRWRSRRPTLPIRPRPNCCARRSGPICPTRRSSSSARCSSISARSPGSRTASRN